MLRPEGMVRLTVALRAASGPAAQDLLEALRFLMATTRLEPGCQDCAAWTDAEHCVHYAEKWASERDVRQRVRSKPFTSLLALMECASEPPDVQFDFVTMTKGLDFVAEVRGETVADPAHDDSMAVKRERHI